MCNICHVTSIAFHSFRVYFSLAYTSILCSVYAFVDFVLIIAISVLSGIVASFSIYRIRIMKNSLKRSGIGFFGSIIGAGAGACSCGSIGFSIVSVFGTIGGTATSFLTNYETPLRLVSIAILCYVYYVSAKDITIKC